MPTIKELPEGERPRERLWELGAGALSTPELMAILIGSGRRGRSAVEIAQDLLAEHQSLDRLARLEAKDFARTKGIKRARAVQLRAAFALGGRVARAERGSRPLNTPAEVAELLGGELRTLPAECLRVVCLNARLFLMGMEEVSRGSINETVAVVRDVLRVPLRAGACAFLLVHNHPSGDPAPSQADLDFTRRVREAAQLMQLDFTDHVILGVATDKAPGYYSFKEAGYL